MPCNVVNGAQCKCSMGSAPSSLVVLPLGGVAQGESQQLAVMTDQVPMMNVMPFGSCSAPSNPAVIAAGGSPSACIPVTPAPWSSPSSKVTLGGVPVITESSSLQCTYGGSITVESAGQSKVNTES